MNLRCTAKECVYYQIPDEQTGTNCVVCENNKKNELIKKAKAAGLTETKRDVLQMLANGLKVKEIADLTYRQPSTIKTHLDACYGILQAHSQVEAVAKGFRGGWLN